MIEIDGKKDSKCIPEFVVLKISSLNALVATI